MLPADLADGRYTLMTGLYDARDGRRLLINDGDDALTLFSFRMEGGLIITDP